VLGAFPLNGNTWVATGSKVQLAPAPGLDSKDDRIALPGAAFRSWMSHTFGRGTLLREDNVFGGLSDAMIDNGNNWCARCEVFRLHTIDPASGAPICPEEWVGQRPTLTINGTTSTLTCTFDGCPAGTTPNTTTGVCDPPCPPGEQFNGFLLRCERVIIIP